MSKGVFLLNVVLIVWTSCALGDVGEAEGSGLHYAPPGSAVPDLPTRGMIGFPKRADDKTPGRQIGIPGQTLVADAVKNDVFVHFITDEIQGMVCRKPAQGLHIFRQQYGSRWILRRIQDHQPGFGREGFFNPIPINAVFRKAQGDGNGDATDCNGESDGYI